MCLFDTINRGLQNGGIGTYLHEVEPLPGMNGNFTSDWYQRGAIDLSFFIIVIVVLMNIIFGIIIDTFSSLRSQRLEREDDIANVCLICSNKRATFERLTADQGGWTAHLARDHDPWSYMAYYIHLQQKDNMDFTGVEQYVYHCISTGSISWFPLNQSLALNAAKEEDSDSDDDILNKVEAVKQMASKAEVEIASLKKDLANVEKNIARTVRDALADQQAMFSAMLETQLREHLKPPDVATRTPLGGMSAAAAAES